jgi:hypothetical protein
MRSFFRSEYAALFVGPAPAYRPHFDSDQSFLRQLTKVQSVSYGFDINREEIKQIGHEDLLTRRINITTADPAPGSNIDVNIEPVPVNFGFEYIPTCGLNEYLLNFNVVPSGDPEENSFISRHFGDKNFFLVLRDDAGKQANHLKDDIDFHGHYVMGIGNAFATRYSTSASVGSLMRSSFNYQASNITVDMYSGDNYIPAIHLYDGKYKEEHQYRFGDEDFANEYDHPGLLPNYISLTIEESNIGGAVLSRENANANAFTIDVDIPRRNLYGFGSMYPYDRKMALPCRGNLNLNIIKKDLETGNLNQILKNDKPYKIYIDCQSNCPPSSQFCENNDRSTLMTYVIDNAVLKNKRSDLAINNFATVSLDFDFTLTRENGFLISGGCLNSSSAPNANLSSPCNPDAASSDADDSTFCDPIIAASPTPTVTKTPTVTPSISVSPTITPTVTKTPTITPTNSVTPTVTATPTSSITPTVTITPTATLTPTITPTSSVTPTATVTATSSITPTPTVTATATTTPTITSTATITPTVTSTSSVTPTATITPTSSITPTPTVTPTATISQTPTITPTISASATVTPTCTITPSISITPTATPSPTPLFDQFVRFQYQSTYLVEGSTASVIVRRDLATSHFGLADFEVDYTTLNAANSAIGSGDASPSGPNYDYISGSGTLSFAVDQTEATINVTGLPLVGVDNGENDEFFYLKLYNPRSSNCNIEITGVNPYSVFIVEPS